MERNLASTPREICMHQDQGRPTSEPWSVLVDMLAAARVVARRNMTGPLGQSSKETDVHPERANYGFHIQKSIACTWLLEPEFEKPPVFAVAAWAAMWPCRLFRLTFDRFLLSHVGRRRIGKKICFERMQKTGFRQKENYRCMMGPPRVTEMYPIWVRRGPKALS